MQPTDPSSAILARQKFIMHLVVSALVIGAILLLVLPVPLPPPLRVGLAAIDLIAAATVWLVGRQHFRRNS
jgi:hypothetical protein